MCVQLSCTELCEQHWLQLTAWTVKAVPHRGALQAAVDAAAGGEGVRPRVSQPRGVEQRDVPVLRLADQRRKVAACWHGAGKLRRHSETRIVNLPQAQAAAAHGHTRADALCSAALVRAMRPTRTLGQRRHDRRRGRLHCFLLLGGRRQGHDQQPHRRRRVRRRHGVVPQRPRVPAADAALAPVT
jgi:hypothetical protein